MPVYVIGFMGGTRRLNHYEAATGWQPLFIIVGVGVAIIVLGAVLQALQLIVGVFQRHRNRVLGDPWNARTLEWATNSPPPVYNFATIPEVHSRDSYWEMKETGRSIFKNKPYEDIYLPKNTGLGLYIGGFSLVMSFAIIWAIWWLALEGLLGIIICMIIRLSSNQNEYCIPAEKVAEMDAEMSKLEKRKKHT